KSFWVHQSALESGTHSELYGKKLPGAPESLDPFMAGQYDLTIVGAGIIGLATALKVSETCPRTRLLILDKEPAIAQHQTGHNSGVIHSGLYYRPGSLKARGCVSGRTALIRFCDEKSIPY